MAWSTRHRWVQHRPARCRHLRRPPTKAHERAVAAAQHRWPEPARPASATSSAAAWSTHTSSVVNTHADSPSSFVELPRKARRGRVLHCADCTRTTFSCQKLGVTASNTTAGMFTHGQTARAWCLRKPAAHADWRRRRRVAHLLVVEHGILFPQLGLYWLLPALAARSALRSGAHSLCQRNRCVPEV